MDFFSDLLMPGNVGIASTLMLYSFVIAAGIYIGKLRIFGVSLGVTFVLFVGILMGHFGYIVDSDVLKFVREFGLILFIFSIGLQVGPGFFSSFKKGGMRLNFLAVLVIALNVAIVLAIYFFGNIHDISALVGVMSGAVTNTPGLAAAQQAVSQMAGGPSRPTSWPRAMLRHILLALWALSCRCSLSNGYSELKSTTKSSKSRQSRKILT